MISFLSARSLLLKEQFTAKHPGAWLVWEPGDWHVPKAEGGVAATIGQRDSPSRPTKGDALCFELKLQPSKPASLKVGRDPGNDVVLNDATVSREHATLTFESPSRWSIEPSAQEKPVQVQDQPLKFGSRQALSPGVRVKLGAVVLTYYDAQKFHERLKKLPPFQ